MIYIIPFSMIIGYLIAEFSHRRMKRKYKLDRLKREYLDNQYWQFITLDEWLSQQENELRKSEKILKIGN